MNVVTAVLLVFPWSRLKLRAWPLSAFGSQGICLYTYMYLHAFSRHQEPEVATGRYKIKLPHLRNLTLPFGLIRSHEPIEQSSPCNQSTVM